MPSAERDVRDAIPDPIVTLDVAGDVVELNRAARTLFDVDDHRPEAPPGAVFEEHPSVASVLASADEGPRDLTVSDDEGQPRHYRVQVSPLGDGSGNVAVFRDITELKRRERELRAERDRYAVLFDSATDCIVEAEFVDGEPIVRAVNRTFEEVFGYEEAELVGNCLDDFIAPDGREEESKRVNEQGRTQETLSREVRRETADGVRDFLLRSAHLDDENTFAVYTDITERKRRERELRDREQQLDVLRQVLTRVLRHNIRNDVNVITIAAEEVADLTDGRPAELARTILDRSEALITYSEKAKRFSDIANVEETTRRYDLSSLVAHNVERFREWYPGATFTLDVPDACPVEASVGLQAALENLLENAVEHSSTSPPPRAREANDGRNVADGPTVAVTIRSAGDGATLVVEDDGPGIPEAEVGVLAAEEETTLYHGSGIGLWIVDWVAEASGADLSFERTGSGTRVSLVFPERADG